MFWKTGEAGLHSNGLKGRAGEKRGEEGATSITC